MIVISDFEIQSCTLKIISEGNFEEFMDWLGDADMSKQFRITNIKFLGHDDFFDDSRLDEQKKYYGQYNGILITFESIDLAMLWKLKYIN